jgi:fructose-1-phosphate kinase PfkB-like protein
VVLSGEGKSHSCRAAHTVSSSRNKRAVNSIRSADSILTGIARQLHNGEPVLDAARSGVGSGAANALRQTAGDIWPVAVARSARRVKFGRRCGCRRAAELSQSL